MSKVISLRDLIKAEPLAGMTQFDVCAIENIDKVNAVLAEIGFDITKATHIFAANHRDMSNKVEVGFLLAGEYNFSRKHIKGPYSTYEDVLLAAQAQDKSLYLELHAMGSTCNDYGAQSGRGVDKNLSEGHNEYSEEELAITNQIKQLEDILFSIRGSQYNPDGSLKTAEDYKGPPQKEIGRQRKKSVKKQQKGE